MRLEPFALSPSQTLRQAEPERYRDTSGSGALPRITPPAPRTAPHPRRDGHGQRAPKDDVPHACATGARGQGAASGQKDLEDVPATVVGCFGGVQLGAGGSVRAYTHSVPQALFSAPKVLLQRMQTLHCIVTYALKGQLRLGLDAVSSELVQVQHGSRVTAQLRLPETQATAVVQRVNDNVQGRLG